MSEEFTKFTTVYNETKKIMVLSEFEDFYEGIKNVYKNESGFRKRFKVMYEDKDMEEYVDLDSPIQLMDRKSNKLYIKSEDEGSKENSNEKASPRYDKFQNYIINLIFQSMSCTFAGRNFAVQSYDKIFTFLRHKPLW